MNWHTGNIAEAVAESKAKDAIFVVYIEGKMKRKVHFAECTTSCRHMYVNIILYTPIIGQDEMTAKLNRFLDDARVIRKLKTSDFVAVKIQGESATYAQFMSLCE